MGERLDVEGGLAGIRPDAGTPVPNKADAAWERLLKLRDEARALGIEVDDAWPIQRLLEEIADHRGGKATGGFIAPGHVFNVGESH